MTERRRGKKSSVKFCPPDAVRKFSKSVIIIILIIGISRPPVLQQTSTKRFTMNSVKCRTGRRSCLSRYTDCIIKLCKLLFTPPPPSVTSLFFFFFFFFFSFLLGWGGEGGGVAKCARTPSLQFACVSGG